MYIIPFLKGKPLYTTLRGDLIASGIAKKLIHSGFLRALGDSLDGGPTQTFGLKYGVKRGPEAEAAE